jgi:hypothetical protein
VNFDDLVELLPSYRFHVSVRRPAARQAAAWHWGCQGGTGQADAEEADWVTK